MNEAQSYVPFVQLVGELKILSREGRTGTAYIVTDDNRMARLGLEAGHIDLIWFHRKRGADALALMSQIQAGRLRFEDAVKAPADTSDLPSTTEILEFLLKQAASDTTTTAANAAGNSPIVASADREMIEEVLTDYLGPMASIICDEHLSEGQDLESALKALATEIQDSAQIKEFLDLVHARLSKA